VNINWKPLQSFLAQVAASLLVVGLCRISFPCKGVTPAAARPGFVPGLFSAAALTILFYYWYTWLSTNAAVFRYNRFRYYFILVMAVFAAIAHIKYDPCSR
jgi:hypothetical protein